MPRAAGNDSNYEWVLFNKATQEYDISNKLEFPSVTTIIGKVLAKPALLPWNYRTTRDNIAGLVGEWLTGIDQHSENPLEDYREILDCLSDGDWLDEALSENKLRPQDYADERAEEGTQAHATLERLANLYLGGGGSDALALAERIIQSPLSDGFAKATADWFIATQPVIRAAEAVLVSLRHGFAGSVDLIWEQGRAGAGLEITDLKSRRKDLGMYDSDDIQTAAYQLAWEEQKNEPISRRSILLVHEDGSWEKVWATLDPEVFLHLKAVYDKLNG